MVNIVRSAAALVLVGLGGMGGVAGAAEAGKGGTAVIAGLKTWTNEWEREEPGHSTLKFKSMTLVGPFAEVEFANGAFVEGAYLLSATEYKHTDSAGHTEKFERADMDIAAGYMFNHYVGLFAGYRNSELEDKEAHVKETMYGPLFGVRGSVPLAQQFSLFGRLTYLLTKMKTEHGGTSETEKAPGYIAEFGGKYNFTDALALMLGYKLETTKTDIHKIKDTFSGVTLDVTYAF